MYFLYDGYRAAYVAKYCHNCWLCDTEANHVIRHIPLPLCHESTQIANSTSHYRYLIVHGNRRYHVMMAFQYVWQALQYLATSTDLVDLTVKKWQLHEVLDSTSCVVNQCDSEWHVVSTPSDMVYKTWQLDLDLWQYAVSQDEDWHQMLNTNILSEIVFQRGDVEFYERLSDAGFCLPSPEHQLQISRCFVTKRYCRRPEVIMALAPRVPSVVTAQMLARYILKSTTAACNRLTSELSSLIDFGDIIDNYGAAIMCYLLTYDDNYNVCLLQNLYVDGWIRPTRRAFFNG